MLVGSRSFGRLTTMFLDVRPAGEIVVHLLQVFFAVLLEMRVNGGLEFFCQFVLARVFSRISINLQWSSSL